jgi:hypothetical protein
MTPEASPFPQVSRPARKPGAPGAGRTRRPRPLVWAGRALVGLGCSALLGWMTLPFADIDGDRVLVHNVRNAEYRTETDYTVRIEDRALDLSKLRSLDLFLIYRGSPLIAHTIMSWGFEGDQYLAISIDRSLPFSVLKAKSHINERAKDAATDPRFSVLIRDGLPRMSLDPNNAGGTQ